MLIRLFVASAALLALLGCATQPTLLPVCYPSTTFALTCTGDSLPDGSCRSYQWSDGCTTRTINTLTVAAVETSSDSHSIVALTAVLVLTSVADLHSTFAARHRLGADFREVNPVMRPFVSAGPVAASGVTVLFDYGLIRMAMHERRAGNRGWWIAPLVASAGHAVAAAHNRKARN